jgi:hypothetical protein
MGKYILALNQKIIKGEALLTIGYSIFGNKSYSYIHSQISIQRKHEMIEQSGI